MTSWTATNIVEHRYRPCFTNFTHLLDTMLPNWPIEDPLIKMSLHGFYTTLSSTWQQILRRRLHIIIASRFPPLCSLPRSSYGLHLVLTPRKIMTDRRLMVAGYRELRDVHCACTASFDPTKKLEFARLFQSCLSSWYRRVGSSFLLKDIQRPSRTFSDASIFYNVVKHASNWYKFGLSRDTDDEF